MTKTPLLLRLKCCNFKPSELGGYSFICVSLREIEDDKAGFPYYFCADVVSINTDGKFVGGAILTYSPHKTLKDAELRWEDLGPAFIEHEGSTGNESGIDMLSRLALLKYRELNPVNPWWCN